VKHFELSEFACPCCDRALMDLEFLIRLDKARESAATPFVITSGYRCEDWNEEVGGVAGSSHVEGFAADISTPDSHTRFLVIRSLIEHGFLRIGLGKDFVHVDADESKPERVAWTY